MSAVCNMLLWDFVVMTMLLTPSEQDKVMLLRFIVGHVVQTVIPLGAMIWPNRYNSKKNIEARAQKRLQKSR